MARTPPSVIVLSILGICYALLALLSAVSTLYVMDNVYLDPATEFIKSDSLARPVEFMELILTLALAVMAMIGSIQSLRLSPSGRTTMIRFAWGNLLFNAAAWGFQFAYVLPNMPAARPGGPGLMYEIISGVVSLVVFVAYSLCILHFYRRRRVHDAFSGIFPAAGTNIPIESAPPQP